VNTSEHTKTAMDGGRNGGQNHSLAKPIGGVPFIELKRHSKQQPHDQLEGPQYQGRLLLAGDPVGPAGGATMQEFTCAKVGDTEWAAARVSPAALPFLAVERNQMECRGLPEHLWHRIGGPADHDVLGVLQPGQVAPVLPQVALVSGWSSDNARSASLLKANQSLTCCDHR
jgi:hypothetical protein